MTTPAPTDLYDQLLVDFPTRRQPTVCFASTVEVLPIRNLDHDLSHRRAVVYKQGFQDNEASEEIRCNRPRKDTPRTF